VGAGFILQLCVNALALSGTYASAALGLTLVFGVLRILNFAHGELLMAGGYVVLILFARYNLPFLITVVVAMIVVGALALAIERGFFRLTRAVPFNGFVISIGLVYVLQVSALILFGSVPEYIPTGVPGTVRIWGTTFAIQRLITLPIIASVMALVWVLLERTQLGRAVRASIQDSEAASLQGISLNRMSAIVMLIAGALAGLGGALLSQSVAVAPYIGTFFILKAFIVVIVGGVGSIGGTMIAALLFGFLDSTVSTLIDPRVSILVDIGVMLLVLIARPRGLFGRE